MVMSCQTGLLDITSYHNQITTMQSTKVQNHFKRNSEQTHVLNDEAESIDSKSMLQTNSPCFRCCPIAKTDKPNFCNAVTPNNFSHRSCQPVKFNVPKQIIFMRSMRSCSSLNNTVQTYCHSIEVLVIHSFLCAGESLETHLRKYLKCPSEKNKLWFVFLKVLHRCEQICRQ